MSESKLGIYEKIYKVMSESPALEKTMTVGSGKNSYKAVSEKVVLNAIKPLLKKHKLIMFPIDTEVSEVFNEFEKTGYNGSLEKKVRMMTQLKVTFRIVDVESGESIDVVGVGSGADPQDKGAGKAFTYALKAAISKSFMLFSGDDTDNCHSDDLSEEVSPAEAMEKKARVLYGGLRTKFKEEYGDSGQEMLDHSVGDRTITEVGAIINSGDEAKLSELCDILAKVAV